MFGNTFKVIYLAGLIAGSVVRGLYTRQYRRNRIADNRGTALDRLLLFFVSLGLVIIPLLYLITPWLNFADYHLPEWTSLAAGLVGGVTFVVAVWLLWRSHVDLGRNWSPTLEIREGHSLVTQGMFRYIRHPIYAAHWLWGIAQALLMQNWIAGLSMLVSMAPLYLYRVPREERMMLERFGQEYREYMNRTGRVMPRLRDSSNDH
jgi:protein-S-isoprenylcysteine O-methyltransferase Ste14